MDTKRRGGVAMALALFMWLTPAAPVAATTAWTHVGTGPLATSTALTAAVRYPAGVAAGDLLLLSCQGRRNSMVWSAPGYTSMERDGWHIWKPAGLRFDLLRRWAQGSESGSLTVRNTTGVNGWSCAITAMRGGPREEAVPGVSATVWQPSRQREMMVPDVADVKGELVMHWFASSDDNNHGRPSHGTLAFGGPAYDTTVGVDHAASMVWHVGVNPWCWPPEECPPPRPDPYESVSMWQLSNGADLYTALTVTVCGYEPCREE